MDGMGWIGNLRAGLKTLLNVVRKAVKKIMGLFGSFFSQMSRLDRIGMGHIKYTGV